MSEPLMLAAMAALALAFAVAGLIVVAKWDRER